MFEFEIINDITDFDFRVHNADYLNRVKQTRINDITSEVFDEIDKVLADSDIEVVIFKTDKLLGSVSKENGNELIKLFDLSNISALGFDFYKPAKGSGMIESKLKTNSGFKLLFYSLVKVDRDEYGGWNYNDWDKKVLVFEENVILLLEHIFELNTVKKGKYSNC